MEGQEASPATVADSLRGGREAKGLSLEDVRSALSIPTHYLEAMEGRASRLIADELYLVPFLRRYAEFLDLDPPLIVSKFLVEAGRGEPAKARRTVPERGRSWLVIAVLALLAIGAIAWLLLVGRRSEAQPLESIRRGSSGSAASAALT